MKSITNLRRKHLRVWGVSVCLLAVPVLVGAQQQDPNAAFQTPATLPQTPAPPQPGQPTNSPDNSTPDTQLPTTNPVHTTPLPDTISAPPFTVSDKWAYRVVQTFGLRGFAGAAVAASIGQERNSPHEWGQSVEGFAKRYGSSFGGNISRQVFATGLEAAFHEDPRYFPSEDTRVKDRFMNAFKQVIFTKTDSSGDSFAYARVISAFGAAEFVNIWQPNSSDSAGHGIERGLIVLAGDAAYDLVQEFVPFTRPLSLRHRH